MFTLSKLKSCFCNDFSSLEIKHSHAYFLNAVVDLGMKQGDISFCQNKLQGV